MSRSMRYFLSFLIGAAFGGGVSFYICRDHFDKTLSEEVEKFIKTYKEKHPVKKDKPEEKEEPKEIPEKDISKEEFERTNPYGKSIMDENEVVHYETYAKKYRQKSKTKPAADMEKLTTKDMIDMYEDQLEEESFDDEEDDFDDDDIYPDEKHPEPYSVDPQGSAAVNSTYDKVTLLWYSRDDILVVEETDEEFSDAARRLGDGWRKAVGEYETDVAYIRNDQLEEDYEIVRQSGRYFGV